MTAHAIVHGTAVTDPLVSVRNLRVSFRLDRHNTFDAVRGISFDIPKNSTVALVGESGAGKTTIGNAVLGLIEKPGRIASGRALRQAGRAAPPSGPARERVGSECAESVVDVAARHR